MKTLGCIVPEIDDSTSLYRAAGPLSLLKEKYRLEFLVKASPATLNFVDAVFMQRPFNNDHAAFIDMASSMGKPIWVDYDDNILDVPPTNTAFPYYSIEQTKKNVEKALYKASVVSVSTEALRGAYWPYNQNIKVIHNCYDKRLMGSFWEKPEPVVVWRGGWSHLADIYQEKDAIIQAANSEAGQKYTWLFIGCDPWFITRNLKKPSKIMGGGMPFHEYHRALKSYRPMVNIFPLEDTALNRSKSNCSWIETTVAGAVTVASDLFMEFMKPGIVRNFKDLEMILALGLEGGLEKLRQESVSYIQKALDIEKENEKRETLLRELIG